MCEELTKGATRVWHPEHKAPYVHNGDLWVGYDDEESIREKVYSTTSIIIHSIITSI